MYVTSHVVDVTPIPVSKPKISNSVDYSLAVIRHGQYLDVITGHCFQMCHNTPEQLLDAVLVVV